MNPVIGLDIAKG